jgi:hypothetical protein
MMGRIDRTVLWILVGVAFLVLAAAALYYANDWWLSGVMTASIVAWLTGVLAAIYGRPERRAVVVGAVLAGFLYMLFAVGPWFRAHVGPWLLTSQALVQIEAKWLGRQAQVQQITYTAVPSSTTMYGSAGSTVLTLPQVTSGATFALAATVVPNSNPSFVVLGHWIFGWIAAGSGALAAAWMTRRAKAESKVEAEPNA